MEGIFMSKKVSEEKRNIIRELLETYDIKSTGDIQNALKDLLGGTIQEMLEAELDIHMGYVKSEQNGEARTNYRNGYKPKKLKSTVGELSIEMPQDRNSEFTPVIVPKHKRDISEIEQKIINMYARGQSTREISEQIEDIYGFETSAEMVSKVTDKIMPQIEAWQNRALSEVYPILFIDAIVFHVRRDKTVQKTAAYIVLGINSEGMKEVLSVEIGENESAKFWLSVLNSLKNRGVRDILTICADGLTGISEAIQAAFPQTEYQRCIVHMVRNTLRHVSEKNRKAFAADLKRIYHAPDEETGHQTMLEVKEKWDKVYPNAMKRWQDDWSAVCPVFKYSSAVRKVLYTTNVIESLNSQYRRLNNSRSVFPSDDALKKALYLSTLQITKKWTMKIHNWGMIFGELSIHFEGRLI